MTPYLQPSADDISRGLLTFDRARPLGEHGLRWLKIHLSGVWGFDKASMEEREDWVDAHLEDIKDSASDPLSVRSLCSPSCACAHSAGLSPSRADDGG